VLLVTSTVIAQAASAETTLQANGTLLTKKTLPHTVCPGNGLDAASAGVIAALVLSGAIGLSIWASRHYLAVPELIDYIPYAARIRRPPASLSTNLWLAGMVRSARVSVAIYPFLFILTCW
jgi:hypothetical protein